MQPTLNIALRAARIASEQIARDLERLDIIKTEQSSLNEFVNNAAASAEKSAAYTIHKSHPEHRIRGRHLGDLGQSSDTSEIEWHIDPIQGESNYQRGLPIFALSLVCRLKGRAEHAVIINPITGEEFTASRGRGAQLNGKRIRVSNNKTLHNSLIGVQFHNRASDKGNLTAFQEISNNILLQDGQLHQSGSAALSLANVAAGRLDGCCFFSLDEWELEAGSLMIQEAGGLQSDLVGGNQMIQKGQLVAGNPKLLKHLLQAIHPALNASLKA